MGRYSQLAHQKFLNSGNSVGYCAICRKKSKLTKDHVPPKSCANRDAVVLEHIYKLHQNISVKKPTISQGGLHFRTICSDCNNDYLGIRYDPALIDVVRKINGCLKGLIEQGFTSLINESFEYQPNKFMRSIVGHLLAANAVEDIKTDINVAKLDAVLRSYFLEPSAPFPENVHFYLWFHPFNKIHIIKHGAMGSLGSGANVIYGHLFKFYPFGVWIVKNAPDEVSQINLNLQRIDLDSSSDIDKIDKLHIQLSPIPRPHWPETPSDDGIWLINDACASQAIPKI